MRGGVKEASAAYRIDEVLDGCQVGYKRTEVGVIPEDWNVETVKEAYDICNTLRLPISRKVREGMQGKYPYYGPTKIQDYLNEYKIEGEYALIGEDGDHFLKYETLPQTHLARGKFNVNNHAHLIRGKKNLTEWFYFYFRNRDISSHLTRQGAGRYKLSKGSLETLPCALPPVREQKEIISVLSDVDALITSLERLITKKRAIKTAAMQQLLTGKKRLPPYDKSHTGYKQTELGEIPEDWDVGKIGQSSEVITKGTTPMTIGRYFVKAGITFVKVESVSESGTFDSSKFAFIDDVTDELLARSRINEGDLLISIAGALGRAIIATKDILPANTNQALAIIRLRNASRLTAKFVYHFTKSALFTKRIEAISSQGAQPNLSLGDIAAFPVIIASKEEQDAITAELDDMDNELNALVRRLTKTKHLKQGMMQELLTGRTRLI